MKGERAIAGAGLALLCGTVALGMMQPITNPDVGWHLAIGRQIAETRSIPTTDSLTHTAAGAPMVAHEWLSQLLYHGIVAVSGVFGLRIFHAALSVAIVGLLYYWLRVALVPPALALLTTLVYVVLVQGRLQIRPHMLHLLCFLALYGALFVRRPSLTRWQLAAVAAGVALWANLHSGVLILPAIVAGYTGVEWLQQRAGWRAPRPDDLAGGDIGRLCVLTGLVGLAALATPHGLQIVPYALESRRVNSALSVEWLSITWFWPHRHALRAAIETYWGVLGAMLVAAVATVGRVSSAQLAVALGLSLLPLVGQRFVVASFAPLLFCAALLSRWLAERQPLRPRLAPRVAAAGFALFLAGAVLTLPLPHSVEAVVRNFTPERNFRGDLFPEGAARFLRAVELESRLFAPERWGGYLSFRTEGRVRTFADGRWVTLGEQVVRDAASIERRAPQTRPRLDAYGIDALLVPRGWMPDEWRGRGGWIPIFANVNAELFLRDRPGTQGDLARVAAYYASVGVPFDPVRGFDERLAVHTAPDWARDHRVRRIHLRQFRIPVLDLQRTGGQRVAGW